MNKRKILALLLAVVMICSLFVSPALAAEDGEPVAISDTNAPKFTDVDGHWAESAIYRWAEAGIVEGYGDGSVNPGRNLRRCELATILARLLGLKATAPAGTFTDVAANAWYADAVLKCAEAGIMLGDGTGKANPESPIDRQQAIVMIGRAIGAKPSDAKSLDRFVDGDAVADWAAPYMATLTDMGILNGLPVGDDFEVAPSRNIDRASTFTLLDKAIAQYITAPCDVTVNDANKFVVVNSAAEDAGTVTITGTAAGVVIGAGTTDDVVLNRATVGTVKVDAPVDVTIGAGSSVTDLDANAAVAVTNNGTVTNLNTNADDVTFDGNKPAAVNTAENVEPATDSKGQEVTTAPTTSTSTGSGSSSRPTKTYKYKVSVPTFVGGKVTADVTQTNEENTEVTLTVTPNAQTSTTLPYILKDGSLKVMNGDEEVTVTNNKFTMAAEGTYTVSAEFVQPIEEAQLFIVNSQEAFDKLGEYGYVEDPQTTDIHDLETTMQWIAVGIKRAEDFNTQTVTASSLTANGAAVSGWPGTGFGKYTIAYVNKNTRDENAPGAKLALDGAAYNFELTFTFAGAEYSFTTNYTKRDENGTPAEVVNVIIKNGNGTVTYPAGKGETVTVPAADQVENKYFTGWDTELATGNTFTVPADAAGDITITAQYKPVVPTTLSIRANGPENHDGMESIENFDYAAAYKALGITFDNKGAITVDAAKLIAATAESASDDLKNTLARVKGHGSLADSVVVGIAYGQSKTAKSVVIGSTLADLDNAAANTVDLATYPDCYDNTLISYIPVASIDPDTNVVTFLTDGDSDYCKWLADDGSIIAVTNTNITVNVTNQPTFDVTFKADDKTVKTVKVDYNTALTADQIPAVPAKEYYTGVWGDTTAKVLQNTTIEAVYTANEYTLKYNKNGGTGTAPADVTFTINGVADDADATIADCEATKAGYKFGRWLEQKDFAPRILALDAGESIKDNAADLIALADDDNVVTLWANWDVYAEVALANTKDFEDAWSSSYPESGIVGENFALVEADKDGVITFTGDVYFVENFTDFSFFEDEQSGYYVAISIKAPDETEYVTDKAVIALENKFAHVTEKTFMLKPNDGELLLMVRVASATKKMDNPMTVTINWQGVENGTDNLVLKFDFSGVSLKTATNQEPIDPQDPVVTE